MLATASYHTANFYREATPDEIGQRIDRSLLKLPMHPPKHLIQRLIRKGYIRINKKKIDPSYRLKEKDIIEFPKIFLEKEEQSLPSEHLHKKLQKIGEDILKTIIYEDEYLLICNKPSGLAVHGGTDQTLGIISALRIVCADVHNLNLVHRLDKPTSGILIFAKDLKTLRHLHQQFSQSQIKKSYLAIVHGKIPLDSYQWTATNNILKKRTTSISQTSEMGKMAQTYFLTLEKFNENIYLLQATPKQGRTHQIRIHSSQYHLPILGDDKYTPSSKKIINHQAKDSLLNKCLECLPKESIYLHAHEIEFIHPNTDKKIKFCAPIPLYWENCFKILR